MEERHVTEAEVLSVLTTRSMEYTSRDGDTNVIDYVDGRRIRLALDEGEGFIEVKTVVTPDE